MQKDFNMRVLLVSPTDPKKPGNLKFLVGGENTYTQTLLDHPPRGVSYIYYMDAAKKGGIEYTFTHKILEWLVKLRVLPLSAGSRVFRVVDDYDLIHCHGYSIKVIGKKIPIVLSDSSSNFIFLRDYINWPMWRIKLGLTLKKFLFEILGVIDPDTNIKGAKKLIVFSKFAYNIHLSLGALRSKMVVIPPGLPKIKRKPVKKHKGISILFVGTWFERKGGPMLLDSFKQLKEKYPGIGLTIVGSVPKKYDLTGVIHEKFVPRKKILKDYFPRADIFVLIPPVVEGYGFVLLEAASFGIPAIVTNVCALSEVIENGKTGFVINPWDQEGLNKRLEKLINNAALRFKMSENAKKKFENEFLIEKSNQKLLQIYRRALG